MKYFLLDFDRSKESVTITPFDDQRAALGEYSRRERRAHGTSHEVVLLGAESEADLRRTHARYFYDISEMSDRALSPLKEPLARVAEGGPESAE